MSEEGITKITSDLAQLENFVALNEFRFKGFAKTLTQAAKQGTDAGKVWTTFSRLSSGTPIWAAQNKIRAYLEILGGFETKSMANIKAMQEQKKEQMEFVRTYNDLTDNVKEFNAVVNEDATGYTVAQYDALQSKIEETIKSTDTYQQILLTTGSEEEARAQAILKMKQSQDEALKSKMQFKKALQDEYAFDGQRMVRAKKIAEQQAKVKGLSSKEIRKAGRKAQFAEASKQSRQQKSAISREFESAKKAAGTAAPLKVLAKPIEALVKPVQTMQSLIDVNHKMVNGFFTQTKKFRKKALEFTTKANFVLNQAFKYFIMATLAIGAIILLVAYAKEFATQFEQFGLLEEVKNYGLLLIDFGKNIYETIMAFVNGGWDEGMAKLQPLLDQAFNLAMQGLEILLKVGFVALVAGFRMLTDFVHKYFTDSEFRNSLNSVLLKVGKIILLAFLVKYFIAQALLIAGVAALPILFGVVILAGLFSVAKYLQENFGEEISAVADKLLIPVKAYFKLFAFIRDMIYEAYNYLTNTSLKDIIVDALNFYVDKVLMTYLKVVMAIGDWVKGLGGKLFGGSSRASGGMVNNSKMTMVGENGAELVQLPQGSRVFNHQVTKNMTGGTTINNYITINAKDTSDNEMRRIADKIAGMVNKKINRTTNSRVYG